MAASTNCECEKKRVCNEVVLVLVRGDHCGRNSITLGRKKSVALCEHAFSIKSGPKRYSRKRVRQELKAAYYPRLLLPRRWLCSPQQPPVPQLRHTRLPAVMLIAPAYPAELPRRPTVDLRWLIKYMELRKNCKHWVTTERRAKSPRREPVKYILCNYFTDG